MESSWCSRHIFPREKGEGWCSKFSESDGSSWICRLLTRCYLSVQVLAKRRRLTISIVPSMLRAWQLMPQLKTTPIELFC